MRNPKKQQSSHEDMIKYKKVPKLPHQALYLESNSSSQSTPHHHVTKQNSLFTK
jgi:hypothetical protein